MSTSQPSWHGCVWSIFILIGVLFIIGYVIVSMVRSCRGPAVPQVVPSTMVTQGVVRYGLCDDLSG